MTHTFRDFVQAANALAKGRGEVLALAHLYVGVLEQLSSSDSDSHAAARKRIIEGVLPQLGKAKRGIDDAGDIATFAWRDAERSLHRYLQGKLEVSLATAILDWLLTVDFEDVSQKWCREACRRAGVTGGVEEEETPTVLELGFGTPFNRAGIDAVEADPMVGRAADLAKHVGFVTLALQQRNHYLLVGKPGVGKSRFLRHLLARVLRGANPSSPERSFIVFRRNDFIGSESENKERFGRLYSYLQQHPDTIPVFDEMEHILRYAPNLAEHFSAMFGGLLAGGGRTLILVCESGVASSTPLLNGIRSSALPALSVADTRKLLLEGHLPRVCEKAGLRPEPNAETLVDALLNMAPVRYPGRFFPELALHISDSMVNRASNRVGFLQEEPLDAVTVADLWAHVVDEQGLNPEIFGKDPKEFYGNLRRRLSNKVIGQDHAVDRLGGVLEMQAARPPQRAPRGRFLFVGPPGVGKTELARSLASELGFGDEAFFVFNMSEYSSESARTRFMGADPGYVGFNSTRTIYQCVRERPSCVVLLDEIDRADSSIQDILLSILEGEGKDSEGASVYFSQAVFVMTTNLGQEAVQAAYESVQSGGVSRAELVEQFGDEQLRRLVLEGASDDTEVAMQARVDQLIQSAKTQFRDAEGHSGDSTDGTDQSLQAIDRYAGLQELRGRLKRSVRTSPLDRALLDRVDFILPFFPIKEPALVARILDLKLEAYGWADCPSETKATILNQALLQQESVRPLERLIKKHLCTEA